MRSHQVVAFNTASDSDNKIHDDDVARRFGFNGGLVPGVDVYAYLTWGPVSQWGEAWLERGTMTARFSKPTYDGHLMSVDWELSGNGEGVARLSGPSGEVVSVGQATCGEDDVPVDLDRFPLAPRPERADRPPAGPASLAVGTVLGTWSRRFDATEHRRYLADVREPSSLFAETAVAHPGWVLRTANWVLADSVVLGPWIHVGSTVRHLGTIRDGDLVQTRGGVAAEYEKKKHRFCELDLAVTADDQPVALIHHTAIYLPRQVAAA